MKASALRHCRRARRVRARQVSLPLAARSCIACGAVSYADAPCVPCLIADSDELAADALRQAQRVLDDRHIDAGDLEVDRAMERDE